MATPSDWLQEAEDDLASLRALLDRGIPKHACFHAQQAGEKALKSVILKHRGRIPKNHNLKDLLGRVRKADPTFPPLETAAVRLRAYYTLVRYPDLRHPGTPMPTMEEARQAARTAEEIVAAARARITPPAPPPPPAPAAP